jgi:hypothetical protein
MADEALLILAQECAFRPATDELLLRYYAGAPRRKLGMYRTDPRNGCKSAREFSMPRFFTKLANGR